MKKISGIAILLCFLGIAPLAPGAVAQCTQSVDLYGTVLDSETSQPIQGVLVCVDEYCFPPCTQGPVVCLLCTQTNASGTFQIVRECTIGMGNPFARWFYLHLSKDGYVARDINNGVSFPPKSCSYPLQTDDVEVDFQNISMTKSSSGVLEVRDGGLPSGFELRQNYPNPFNLATTISFSLSEPASADLVIYDILGRVIYTEDLGHCAVGLQTIEYDGLDAAGRPLQSGVYFYRITAGSYGQVRRMVVLK